jgi:hypothetical protein
MTSGLDTGFLLDRQWHWLRGEMDTTKKPALLLLGRVLAASRTPYAIIGGVAVQIHHPDPRTTIDIDVAVPRREVIPRDGLVAAGFRQTGSFEHSENWVFSNGTPLQFTADPALASAIEGATEIVLDEVPLRIINAVDLLHEKIRSGSDPARRRSKRLQDLSDAQALLEANPDLEGHLREDEREILDRLPE